MTLCLGETTVSYKLQAVEVYSTSRKPEPVISQVLFCKKWTNRSKQATGRPRTTVIQWPLFWDNLESWQQKGRNVLDFNEYRDDGGEGVVSSISWTICKSFITLLQTDNHARISALKLWPHRIYHGMPQHVHAATTGRRACHAMHTLLPATHSLLTTVGGC